MLELTGTVDVRQMEAQVLDDMDLEKERGITIKSHAIQMAYKGYTLNLIDTPGHVDFSYEVSRSIAACEGAVLVVDATQGVQAQTISNLYMAIEHDLEIIPVLNKCDMDNAMPERVEDEIVDLLGCKREEILRCSAKTGEGVPEILDAILQVFPLDTYVEHPVSLMEVMPGDPVETPIWDTYKEIVAKHEDRGADAIGTIERFAFYEEELSRQLLFQVPVRFISGSNASGDESAVRII